MKSLEERVEDFINGMSKEDLFHFVSKNYNALEKINFEWDGISEDVIASRKKTILSIILLGYKEYKNFIDERISV